MFRIENNCKEIVTGKKKTWLIGVVVTIFVSPAKHGRHIGIMSPSSSELNLLRNRGARTFTPQRLQLQPLVGWQVNSTGCSISNLHRDKLHSLF